MHTLVIFASGRGSNAQAIIDYFRSSASLKVELIVSNKSNAGVLDIAQKEEIPSVVISKTELNGDDLLQKLKEIDPTYIVLAGFLLKIPEAMVRAFKDKIINIHPSLLPNYGGKGMYGDNVHKAVIAAKEKESGITIHYVDEVYDNGFKILQARCQVEATDDSTTLAQRIHKLEHFFFPRTIEYLLEN